MNGERENHDPIVPAKGSSTSGQSFDWPDRPLSTYAEIALDLLPFGREASVAAAELDGAIRLAPFGRFVAEGGFLVLPCRAAAHARKSE